MNASNVALGLTSLPAPTVIDALERAQQLGFESVSLAGAPGVYKVFGDRAQQFSGFFWDDLSEQERADLQAARGNFGRSVIHAPFVDLPLISTNLYIEREVHRQVSMSIRAAGALNLDVVTVHCVGRGNIPQDVFMDRVIAKVRTLGDEAAANGTRIGVENLGSFPVDPDEYVQFLDEINHPAVGATLDVGHVAYWLQRDGITSLTDADGAALYNDRLLTMIDRLGERIIHIHVHDVDPATLKDHRAVGRGIIDFDAVMWRLDALGYNGLLEMELAEPDIEPAIIETRARLVEAMERTAVVA